MVSVVTGWIPYSSARCQGHMGSYCYIPSWPVFKTNVTQNPQRGNIYLYQGAPGHAEAQAPFLSSQVRWLVTESRLPVLNHRVVE
jgi:hypothetical protein